MIPKYPNVFLKPGQFRNGHKSIWIIMLLVLFKHCFLFMKNTKCIHHMDTYEMYPYDVFIF